MPMLKDPSAKYPGFSAPSLPSRTWPDKKITKAPRWLATDLRDGNQALAAPLNKEQKWKLFSLLVEIGFKEIECGFPSASDTDFEFTKTCVKVAPSDVWLQVLCSCRKELIRHTVDSVTGARKATISLYLATSDLFLDTVFGCTQEDILQTAVESVLYLRSITKDDPVQSGNTTWNLMFSPETFSDTDPAFAITVCKAVRKAWNPESAANPMILNLPATVEMATPNVFADQVETFCRSFNDDDRVIVSVHPHNDRGCAVAAAELAQLAGAKRVEGCLFGNGERTGNVDLVTLALNLYTQGISPNLDFSRLPAIKRTLEELTQIPVHPRAPYAGDAVFLAYSGGHQDAIHKALEKRKHLPSAAHPAAWKVPYLIIDPADIGSSYEAIIRINSQSGRGGISWVLERAMGQKVSKNQLQAFVHTVKSESERRAGTLNAEEIKRLFLRQQIGL